MLGLGEVDNSTFYIAQQFVEFDHEFDQFQLNSVALILELMMYQLCLHAMIWMMLHMFI